MAKVELSSTLCAGESLPGTQVTSAYCVYTQCVDAVRSILNCCIPFCSGAWQKEGNHGAQRIFLMPASCRSCVVVIASFPAQLGGKLPGGAFQGSRGPLSLASAPTDQPAP